MTAESHTKSQSVEDARKSPIVPIILITCVVIVAFWEIMARRSARPFKAFQLTAADFAGFLPASDKWAVRRLDVASDHPSAPNLFAFELRNANSQGVRAKSRGAVLVRLVHGYNMPACMRLKGYVVDGVEAPTGASGFSQSSQRTQSFDGIGSSAAGPNSVEDSDLSESSAGPARDNREVGRPQVWVLTSDIGDKALWVTAMVRAGDYGMTDVDIEVIAFPRIASGDDPRWVPRGLTLKSCRHPVRNFRRFMARKWSNARCDLLTFLKLRQPAWASEDVLTLVAATDVPHGQEAGAGDTRRAEAALMFIQAELRKWHGSTAIEHEGSKESTESGEPRRH